MKRETRVSLRNKILVHAEFLLDNEQSVPVTKTTTEIAGMGDAANKMISKDGDSYFLYSLDKNVGDYKISRINKKFATKLISDYLSGLSRQELTEELEYCIEFIGFLQEDSNVFVMPQEYTQNTYH